jgi:hypothetical protein
MEADASGVEAVVFSAVRLEGNCGNDGVEGGKLDGSDIGCISKELGNSCVEVLGVALLIS